MCDASNFGIGAALLQSHSGTNKMNLISANSRLFTQTELRLSNPYERVHSNHTHLFLVSNFPTIHTNQKKNPTDLFTDHKPIILFLHKNQIQTIEFIDYN